MIANLLKVLVDWSAALGGEYLMWFKHGAWLVLAFMFFTSGCASMIGDDTQPVSIDTPQCPTASCRMTNSQGTYFVKSTPETVVINKAYSDLNVTCEKDGKTADSIHVSKANGATYGNILLGGLPGALIDGGSGAGYDYQSYLVNPLNCINLTGQADAPSVSSTSPVSSINPTSIRKVEDRLRELKKLQEDGLISDEEAKKKRQEIIEAM